MNKYFKRLLRLIEKYNNGEISDVDYIENIAHTYCTDGLITPKQYKYILDTLNNKKVN